MTTALPTHGRTAEAERVIRALVEEHADDLAELLEIAASASHQTSHSNDDASSVHERDALVQELAAAVTSPTASAEVAQLRDELAQAQQRLHDAAMTRVWRNEDGKKFVFVEDIAPHLLGTAPGGERS